MGNAAVRTRITLRAFVAVACLAGGCSRRAPIEKPWHQEAGYRWRELDIVSGGHAGFERLSSRATGITHSNDVDDEHAMANRNLLIGAGAALGDIDGDGRPDVFLASVEKPGALYHNDGGFHFTDVTTASGINTKGLATTGAVFTDVDGDGDLDLICGTLGGPLKLWLNDGNGHFTDATASSGLTGGYGVTTLTLADVDGNGTLDLYVATYKTRNALDAFPPEARTFDQVVKKVNGKYEVADTWKKEYRVEERPELGGVVRSQRADPDLFFLNDGHGHFTRAPMTGSRFLNEDGKPLAVEPDYFTLAARFYDVNGDGAPDLYVCNDFEDPDQFWLNDGKGSFRLAPALSIRETSNTCMSVDFADVNRDGHVDVFATDMLSATLADRQRQISTSTPLPKQVGLTKDRGQWMQNTLQLARGDGTWAQAADFAGVSATDWSWGSAFLDVDLDGYEDLLVVNGHRWDIRDADTFERISSNKVPWNREQGEFPRLDARNVAFRNDGNASFADANRAWGFGDDKAISHGIALADFDGDGDLDVLVTRLDAPPAVYRNESDASRVAVQLKGANPNGRGIGATVTVRAASLPPQTREMTAGGYYLSGSDAELAFATGRDSLVTIEVKWRSGRVSTLRNVARNRVYEVDESVTSAPQPALDSEPPLFTSATALLGGHLHVDSLYDDYRRQPLLPNRFSQLGPGVSWIDTDGDGREDLVIGAGHGGTLAVLHNSGSRFTASRAPTAKWDLTTILPAPDGKGGTTLLAGQSSYESASPTEALSVASVVGFPLRGGTPGTPTQFASPESASVGPLALGDVDGDGRLDVFVGARVIPGTWPFPAPSRILHRTAEGGFVADTMNAKVLAKLGLLSSALFADIDGDGWPELIVAAEWGPVRVLHNERGRLRDVTREWGLGETTSRWNGLAAGDFDGDGRLDLVATSWGLNIPWTASRERPFELVIANFGMSGAGLLFARRDSASGREMPLESFSRIGALFPAVRERIASFSAYSKSSIDEVVGSPEKAVGRVGATTFEHTLFLNRGGRFEPHALPRASQIAPAFGVVVADFNGDGREDLFLAQNFSPTAMGTMRFDGGAGQLLLGDGRGGFRALGVNESGIAVLGDGRGAAAADYDADGRVDLAVAQNGAETTLWHNDRAAPGLRVKVNGGPNNPLGVGTQLRIVAGAVRGPVREVRAGGGYWSMDGAVTVLALPPNASALWVRWPLGREEIVPIAQGQRDVTITAKP
ncbi:MAG: ASPIC/UnbV domain protein [Gemmatimonadetes bacterium]|nr:ASPIC/UnbV domain protein [Gemmatimonadota bacterium]